MAGAVLLTALTTAVREGWAAESRAAAQRLKACYELLYECLRQDEAGAGNESRPGHAVVDPFDVAVGYLVSATAVSARRATTMLNFSWELNERFPAVMAALSAGRIEVRVAEMLVRQMELVDHTVLEQVQQEVVEQYLAALEAGERLGVQAVRDRVDEVIKRHDVEGVRRRREDAARARGVRIDKGSDGMSTLRATLHSDEMAVLAEAIDHHAAEQADAEAEAAASAAAAAEAAGEPAPVAEGDGNYPLVQRRADALLSLVCGDVLGSDEAAGGPATLRPKVTVIASGGDGDDDERTRVEFTRTGQAALQALLDMLAHSDGASIERVDPRLGAADQPDRALIYRPGAGLARRVRLRDGTCRHPGCTVPATACDLDHVVPFDHADPGRGGRTEEANLAALCRRHHRFKTFSDWTYRLEPDGTLIVTSPDGATMVTRPSGPLAAYRREQVEAEAHAWCRQLRRSRETSEPTYWARRATRLAAERAGRDRTRPSHASRWRRRNVPVVTENGPAESAVEQGVRRLLDQVREEALDLILDPPPF